MRHFIIFLILIFSGLGFFHFQYTEKTSKTDDRTIHVYASSSFIAKWGPAPALKELFDKQNVFKVEFIESPDISMTLQKINFEGQNSNADVVLGLDQFDISRSSKKITWRVLDKNLTSNYVSEIEAAKQQTSFVAYDWSPMSFVGRQGLSAHVEKMDDLIKDELKNKIALQDPRTSSPGMQFLAWVFETKAPEQAVQFLKALVKNSHSFSSSWSGAYGLFKNKQVDLVYSYVTSPIYHLVEDNDSNYLTIEFAEPLPVQVEFAGIPDSCKNCEGAEQFLHFLLSKEAQKIIMSKNYMLPAVDHVKEATAFDAIKVYKTLPVKFYEPEMIDKWINQWSEIRKNEGS